MSPRLVFPKAVRGLFSDPLVGAVFHRRPVLGAVDGSRILGLGAPGGRGLVLAVSGAHLPDTRLLAVHHGHVAGLSAFDEPLLRLVELLGHEAHEGVVRGVSCSQTTRSGRGLPDSQGHALGLPGPVPSEGSLFGKDGEGGWEVRGPVWGGESIHPSSVPWPPPTASLTTSPALSPRSSLLTRPC